MWHPYFDEVLLSLSDKGFREAIVVVMAAHSAHVYEAALRESATKLQEQGAQVPILRVAPCWGDHPALIDCYSELTLAMLERLTQQERSYTQMITSAHSLPMRAITAGDPYPQLVSSTARLVVDALGERALAHTHAFQSQGMSQEAWLGPELSVVFDQAKQEGFRQVLVVPVGFLADHVETLFDLDIEAKQLAQARGLSLMRCRCPNLHDKLIEAIVGVAAAMM
jgi:ferrochelatase